MDSKKPLHDGAAPADAEAVRASRRRFVRGGLASAPVLLSVVSRPVSATGCSAASSFASVNMSRGPTTYTCGGLTPGYWKQPCKFWDWPTTYIPSATLVTCTGTDANYNPPANTTATLFDTVFGANGGYPGKTLVDVLSLPGNDYGRDALARHIVAALLNATKGITPSQVLSVLTVKNIWSSFVTLGYYAPTSGVMWYANTSDPTSTTGGIIEWLKSTMPL